MASGYSRRHLVDWGAKPSLSHLSALSSQPDRLEQVNLPRRRSLGFVTHCFPSNVCWNEQPLPFFGRLLSFKETNQHWLIVTRKANHMLWRKGNRHPWLTRGSWSIFRDKLLTRISIIFHFLIQLLECLRGRLGTGLHGLFYSVTDQNFRIQWYCL